MSESEREQVVYLCTITTVPFICMLHSFLADTTGEFSIFTEYENSEIMFHVSTLLPFTGNNKQQVIIIHKYILMIMFCNSIVSMSVRLSNSLGIQFLFFFPLH